MDTFLYLLKIFIIPAACAFFLSYLLTPLTARAAAAVGAIDSPDGVRKINTRPVPRLGGLGFFTAFAICAILFIPFGDRAVSVILLAGGALVFFGIIDDARGLSPLFKLLAQCFCASIIVFFLGAPQSLSVFGIFSIPLPAALAVTLGIGRIAFTVNAVNFSDGLDGLAAGISVIACICLGIYALRNGKPGVCSCALIIAAGVLGFLPFNKYKAKIFMGDSGSQFLGLSIAALTIAASPDGGFNLATSLFLAVPLFDTWASIIRRTLHGKSPFSADRGHIHHLLLSLGLSHPAAVKVLLSLSALLALSALFFI